MPVEKKNFGLLGTGEEVSLYLLKSGDFCATVTDYGATLVSFLLPDGKGGVADLLLGFSTLGGYTEKQPYFGATVGRYANRLALSRFALDGREYPLAANNGPNHLHGGVKGFDKYLWRAEPVADGRGAALALSRTSPDGEEGYPGRLEVMVLYRLSDDGSLSISFEARTDAKTVVNLTNHAYFNLAGEGRGDILDHELRLASSRYLPVDQGLIPTGELRSVAGSPFDFRSRKRIGAEIPSLGGYDHCFVIDRSGDGLVECAEVWEPKSGRRMTVATTLPGLQFYTGNFLSGIYGKRGSVYDKHAGFCLETELYPDSPNRPSFPSALVEPDKVWGHETVYRFFP